MHLPFSVFICFSNRHYFLCSIYLYLIVIWCIICPWASIAHRAPPTSMLTYLFKSSYISSWRKNMLTLKILGRTCRLRLIFTPCRSFLRIFFNVCLCEHSMYTNQTVLKVYQYDIKWKLIVLSFNWIQDIFQILSDVKTLPLPLPEMKKKEFVSLKSLDKKLFRTKLRSFLY